MRLISKLLFLLLLTSAAHSFAGAQEEEILAPSVAAQMRGAVADMAAPKLIFATKEEGDYWLAEMSRRMEKRIPDEYTRINFLTSVQYESARAGLDPALVLGLIQVESAFHKYAISSVSARGYMQVMPFWVKYIGNDEHNLFHLRTNLRFGCTILRHYLDMEKGNLYLALGRYNGSRGKPDYPNAIFAAWKNWMIDPLPGKETIQASNN